MSERLFITINSRRLTHLMSGCLLLAASLFSIAGQVVVDDLGRQVQLNDDGSWRLISSDRYAISNQGERVKLRPDGSWIIVPANATNEVIKPLDTDQSHNQLNSSSPTLLLTKVEILKKTVKTSKSRRIDTRMQFTLRVTNNSGEQLSLTTPALDLFEAKSSDGENFDILSASFTSTSLNNGDSTILNVIADGSPKWFGVKYITLLARENAVAHSAEQLFSFGMSDIDTKAVEQF